MFQKWEDHEPRRSWTELGEGPKQDYASQTSLPLAPMSRSPRPPCVLMLEAEPPQLSTHLVKVLWGARTGEFLPSQRWGQKGKNEFSRSSSQSFTRALDLSLLCRTLVESLQGKCKHNGEAWKNCLLAPVGWGLGSLSGGVPTGRLILSATYWNPRGLARSGGSRMGSQQVAERTLFLVNMF